MKLDEAIRVNTVLKKAPVLKDDPIIQAALNLNIEALKVIQLARVKYPKIMTMLLPGETKE